MYIYTFSMLHFLFHIKQYIDAIHRRTYPEITPWPSMHTHINIFIQIRSFCQHYSQCYRTFTIAVEATQELSEDHEVNILEWPSSETR